MEDILAPTTHNLAGTTLWGIERPVLAPNLKNPIESGFPDGNRNSQISRIHVCTHIRAITRAPYLRALY